MSSAKKDYERLEQLVEDGGKWERSFRKKTFRKFTAAELEAMKEDMRRMVSAHAPPMYKLTKDVTCPTPKKGKGTVTACGHVFKKKDEWVPRGVMLLACPACGERHSMTVRPERQSEIRNPKSAIE